MLEISHYHAADFVALSLSNFINCQSIAALPVPGDPFLNDILALSFIL